MQQTSEQIRFISRLFLTGLILYLLACRVLLLFSYQANIAGFEQVFIYYTQRLLSGLPLYTDPELPPFSIAQYAPLYFHAIAGLARLLPIDPHEDIMALYQTGRTINLACNLVTLYLAYRIAALQHSPSWLAAAFVVIIGFCFITPHHIAVRPDSMEICLLTIFLYLLIRHAQHGSLFTFFLALSSGWLAVFTKQTALPEFGLILAVYLYLHKDQAWSLLPVAVLSLLVPAVLYFHFIHGQYAPVLVSKLADRFSGQYLWVICRSFGLYLLFLLSFSAYCLFHYRAMVKPGKVPQFLLAAGVVVLAYDIFSLSLWGATIVYLSAGWILFLALALAVPLPDSGRTVWICIGILFLATEQGNLVKLPFEYKTTQQTNRSRYDNTRQTSQYLTRLVNSPEDRLLTFDKLLINFQYERALFPTYEAEFIQYSPETPYIPIYPSRRYTYAALRDLQKAHQPEFLVLHAQPVTDSFLSVRFKDYRLLRTIGDHRVYQLSAPRK